MLTHAEAWAVSVRDRPEALALQRTQALVVSEASALVPSSVHSHCGNLAALAVVEAEAAYRMDWEAGSYQQRAVVVAAVDAGVAAASAEEASLASAYLVDSLVEASLVVVHTRDVD